MSPENYNYQLEFPLLLKMTPPRPPQRDLANQLEDAEAAHAMIVNRDQ